MPDPMILSISLYGSGFFSSCNEDTQGKRMCDIKISQLEFVMRLLTYYLRSSVCLRDSGV